MSQFSRRSKWLNNIFPASVSPQIVDPNRVSEDVSLVQPYDASGWAVQDISTYCERSDIQGGITGFVILREVAENQVFRLLGADVALLAGIALTEIWLNVIDSNGTGNQVQISNIISANAGGLNPGQTESFDRIAKIIGPGCHLRADWVTGAVGTDFTIGIYGAIAPLGTIFYV